MMSTTPDAPLTEFSLCLGRSQKSRLFSVRQDQKAATLLPRRKTSENYHLELTVRLIV